jgi:hypothetical protein
VAARRVLLRLAAMVLREVVVEAAAEAGRSKRSCSTA